MKVMSGIGGRRVRVAVAAAVTMLAVPSLTMIRANADIGLSYPGGCVVEVEVTALNNTCSFVNLASDIESLQYEGSGTVTVSTHNPNVSCPSTSHTFSASGSYSLGDEVGGCTYDVSTTGGMAVAYDSNVLGLGYCFTASNPPPPDPRTVNCNYVAVAPIGSSTGVAVGMAISTVPITYTIVVTDQTTATPVNITSCPAGGVGVLTQECFFTEQPGHIYYDTVNVTSAASPQVLGVVGEG